jgi:hypothetical protein
MPVIPPLGRLREEDFEFKANLGYMARCYVKNFKKKIQNQKKVNYEALYWGINLLRFISLYFWWLLIAMSSVSSTCP